VVADEVRKLAEKSGKSATEIDLVTRAISAQSHSVQEAIRNGEVALESSTQLAEAVEVVLNQARQAVESSSHGVDDISSSVAEQQLASTEIAQNMERIANMSDENTIATRSVSEAAQDLTALAQRLQSMVANFKIA